MLNDYMKGLVKSNKNILGIAILIVVVSLTMLVSILLQSCQTNNTGLACEIFGAALGNPASAESGFGEAGDTNTEISYEEALAKCLTSKGINMYGSVYCGHCNAQKESFGEAFQYIDYVECSGNSACAEAGISGVPTWVDADGNKYPGNRKLSELAEIFEC